MGDDFGLLWACFQLVVSGKFWTKMSWETLPNETLFHLRTFFAASATVALRFTANAAFSPESQAHASPGSKPGHVTSKTGHQSQATQSRRFESVLIFSMNDEVVHTANRLNAHYLLILCTTPVR
jgi:hypothetical protein